MRRGVLQTLLNIYDKSFSRKILTPKTNLSAIILLKVNKTDTTMTSADVSLVSLLLLLDKYIHRKNAP